MSADRRRTLRQAKALTLGRHPLGLALGAHLPLHPEAAPAGDRTAEGRRCGNCAFRQDLASHQGRAFPKCAQPGMPVTHGALTDVRAWWPGCVHHDPITQEQVS